MRVLAIKHFSIWSGTGKYNVEGIVDPLTQADRLAASLLARN
jgi:hypothetical protein